MFISRFWTLLLTLTAGIGLAVILLARDVVNKDRVDSTKAILYKELTKVDVALKLHARMRLDVLLAIAVDPQIRSLLAASSLKSDKSSEVRDKLLTALRNRNKDLVKYRADLLLALDANGVVIAQVGMLEHRYGYSLKGFPVVNAALRGYQRDDIWKLGNDVLLVSALPVIEQGQYVGALLHAMTVTDRLVSDLSPGMQLAFYSGDLVIAVGTPRAKGTVKTEKAYIAKPLDKVKTSAYYREKGYSEVEQIDTKEGKFMAVYSLVRGEASGNEIGYAVVTSVERVLSPAEFYEKASSEDINALPLTWIVSAVLLATLIGWILMYLEGQRPISRLFAHIKEVEKSDPKDQLNVYRFRHSIRKLAEAINTLLDTKIRLLMETDASHQKSIDSILGESEVSRLSSAKFKFIEPKSSDIPEPPPPSAAPIAPKQPSGKISVSVAGPQAQPVIARKPTMPLTPVTPQTKDSPVDDAEDEKEYFKKIFEEFVLLKKNLGEPIDQLNFERFEGTLKRNRDTLKARYGCKKVLFQVYEKDGKTSLKATPIRD